MAIFCLCCSFQCNLVRDALVEVLEGLISVSVLCTKIPEKFKVFDQGEWLNFSVIL